MEADAAMVLVYAIGGPAQDNPIGAIFGGLLGGMFFAAGGAGLVFAGRASARRSAEDGERQKEELGILASTGLGVPVRHPRIAQVVGGLMIGLGALIAAVGVTAGIIRAR